MQAEELENVNPRIFEKLPPRSSNSESDYDPVDAREVFDLICSIRDPEHPMTLEELGVVDLKNIKVDDAKNEVIINYTPTIPHCSMATLIGLSIRVKLFRSLAPRFKVRVEITPGTHSSENAINKQLADKERIAAAMENKHLSGVINQCISFKNDESQSTSSQIDLDKIVKKHIYGKTFEVLDKQNEKIKKIGKFDFLKDSNPDLYKNYMFLEKLTEDEQNSKIERNDIIPPKTCEDVLSELEYLQAC